MLCSFTFDPSITLPSNKNTKDDLTLANITLEKYFPNFPFKVQMTELPSTTNDNQGDNKHKEDAQPRKR